MVARRMTKTELKKREEMNALTLRSEVLTSTLHEQHLRRDLLIAANESSTSRLEGMRRGMEERAREWDGEVGGVVGGMGDARERGERECQALRGRTSELMSRLTASDVIDRENSNLRKQVNRLREELEEAGGRQGEELGALRAEMFDTRMKVETTFRKTLQTLEKEYKTRAYTTMAQESQKALEENIRLNSSLREKRSEVLGKMHQQSAKETKMRRDKINRDILENTVATQEQEIDLLERYGTEQSKVVARVKTQIATLHARLRNLQEKENLLLASAKRLERQRKKSAGARGNAGKWIGHVEGMCKAVEEWSAMGCPIGHVVGPEHLAVRDYWSRKEEEEILGYKDEDKDKDKGDPGGEYNGEEDDGDEDIWRASANEGAMVF